LTTKTLGQIAYEAFEKKYCSREAWSSEGLATSEEAWQAAAEAVLESQRRPYGGDEQTEHLERIGRERAVIEAARRLAGGTFSSMVEDMERVRRAIEALDKAEAGDE
jgi:hypothetical protein